MNIRRMDKNNWNKSFDWKKEICLLLFCLCSMLVAIQVFNYWDENQKTSDKDAISYVEQIRKDEKIENVPIYIDIKTMPEEIAKYKIKSVTLRYYIVRDDDYFYVVQLSGSTLKKIQQQYRENGGVLNYHLKGYMYGIPRYSKKAIGNYFVDNNITYKGLDNETSECGLASYTTYMDEMDKKWIYGRMLIIGWALISGIYMIIRLIKVARRYYIEKKEVGSYDATAQVDEVYCSDNDYKTTDMFIEPDPGTGRSIVLRKLKYKGVIGILTVLVGLGCGIYMLFYFNIDFNNMDSRDRLIILVSTIVICFFLWNGLKFVDYFRGEKSRYVAKRKNYLELADDLLGRTVYEDNKVVISEKAIAAKKNLTEIVPVEWVKNVYFTEVRYNRYIKMKVLRLEIRDGRTIDIDLVGLGEIGKEKLLSVLKHYCVNAYIR